MQHSPAPWKHDGNIIASGLTQIARVHAQTCIGACEIELPCAANAALIAAAPELLQVLDDLFNGTRMEISVSDSMHDRIVKVLRKARGL